MVHPGIKKKNKFEITKEDAVRMNAEVRQYQRTPEEIRCTIDEPEVIQFHKMITHGKTRNHKYQVFLPDKTTIGPYDVNNADELVKLCKKYNLYGLSCLSVNSIKTTGMKTHDVEEISNILFDVDVPLKRKVDGVSTEEDKKIVYETALKIKKKLEEEINLTVSMFNDSGNGNHIVIPVSIPLKDIFTGENEKENNKIWMSSDIRGRLVTLENKLRQFDNDVCHVDCISKDIARRFKITGTWNVKEGIDPDNYRQCKIIEYNDDAVTDDFVEDNTTVFNAIESIKENAVIDDIEIPVDENKKLNDVLEKNEKAKDLFNGHYEKYNKKKDGTKKKKWTKSEAEQSLCVILLNEGLSEESVRLAMSQAKIGKWNQSTKYQDTTIEKSKQFVKKIQKQKEDKNKLLLPNHPIPPVSPILPNLPNLSDNTYLLSLLNQEKRPFQSIGRGLHNGVCYIGTYLEDDNTGHTYDAVVTSDRRIFLNTSQKIGNEWQGRNSIKMDFGLKYRDSFFADVLDFTWGNPSIKKFLMAGYTVDISNLFDRIVKVNQKFMRYEDEFNHKFVALDILRSFFHFLFTANSRIYFHAEKGSGKTNQLMIYRALCFNPVSSPDFSSASIYRVIESTSGTILIDDFDQLPDEQKNAIILHIRANYKPFKVLRADSSGRSFRPRGFNAYSHLVFNNVMGMGYDDVTLDRCIIIRLLKHKDVLDITVDYKDPIFSPIRDDLYVCLLQYWDKVKKAYDSLKVDGLTARELELFKPLLAISKVIGGNLYDKLLEFAKEYFKQEGMKELSDDWEFCLLKCLWLKVKDMEDDKQIITVAVKELSDEIKDELRIELDSDAGKKKLHSLRIFIGNKLTSYLFKKKNPQNKVKYDVYKERISQILEVKGWLGLLGVWPLDRSCVAKNNDGKYVIAKEFENLNKQVTNIMNEKLLYDWSINELSHALGYESIEKRTLLKDFLVALTENPHNPSDIGKSVDDEHYHLTVSRVKGGENGLSS